MGFAFGSNPPFLFCRSFSPKGGVKMWKAIQWVSRMRGTQAAASESVAEGGGGGGVATVGLRVSHDSHNPLPVTHSGLAWLRCSSKSSRLLWLELELDAAEDQVAAGVDLCLEQNDASGSLDPLGAQKWPTTCQMTYHQCEALSSSRTLIRRRGSSESGWQKPGRRLQPKQQRVSSSCLILLTNFQQKYQCNVMICYAIECNMLFTRYNAMAGDVCFDSVWPLHNCQLCLNLNLKPVATISINNAFKKSVLVITRWSCVSISNIRRKSQLLIVTSTKSCAKKVASKAGAPAVRCQNNFKAQTCFWVL